MIKSRFSHLKWTTVVVVLTITIIAGALLVYGHANPPDGKFSVQDATTREGNGKRLRAKAGFELVKDGEGVSVRRRSKPTESSADSYRLPVHNNKRSLQPPHHGSGRCHFYLHR